MIPNEIKKIIYEKRTNGKSYGSIAKELHLSRSTVQKIIVRRKNMCKKRGPKERISKFEKRRIRSFITDQFNQGKKVSCKQIVENFNLNVHRTTILRVLRCLKYNYKNLPYKFKLSPKLKSKRVAFAKKCLIENVNWQKVVFSDEKRFSLNGCDSFYTWVHSNQSPSRVRKVIKAPGLMVWAMVLPNGLISFQFLKGNQSADNYIQIIKNVVIPISRLNLTSDYTYQHDNCPIHVARKTRNYCTSSNLKVLDWPASSPDLNIIENLWQIISLKVYEEGAPQNIKELKIKVIEAIHAINESQSEIVKNLYNSIRGRLCEVIFRRGERINC